MSNLTEEQEGRMRIWKASTNDAVCVTCGDKNKATRYVDCSGNICRECYLYGVRCSEKDCEHPVVKGSNGLCRDHYITYPVPSVEYYGGRRASNVVSC